MPDNVVRRAPDRLTGHDQPAATAQPDLSRYSPDLGDAPVGRDQEQPRLTHRQERHFEHRVDVRSGTSYIPPGEPAARTVATVPKQAGIHMVHAYGVGRRIGLPDGRGGYDHVGAGSFAPLLLRDPGWNGTDVLMLAVCRGGRGFAQDLYRVLDGRVSIMATRELVASGGGRTAAVRCSRIDRSTGMAVYEPVPDAWFLLKKRGSDPGQRR